MVYMPPYVSLLVYPRCCICLPYLPNHPFHCWSMSLPCLPNHPFHCWSLSLPCLPNHPFHCWSREAKRPPRVCKTVVKVIAQETSQGPVSLLVIAQEASLVPWWVPSLFPYMPPGYPGRWYISSLTCQPGTHPGWYTI